MAKITFKGTPVTTIGELPAVGNPRPDFSLADAELNTRTAADFKDRWVVFNMFPSLDTDVCAASVRRFNEAAVARPDTAVLCISADLPFAQARFCGAEGLDKVITLSCFRSPSFGRDFGVSITDSPLAGLLARAVLVCDPQGVIRYANLVPEIAREPDYDAALAVLPQ